jgi:hypothetical protein
MPFFVASCRANPTVTWWLPSDAGDLPAAAPNVRVLPTTLADYAARIGGAIGLRLGAVTPYKLCDLKPTLGLVHADELQGVDHYGFCDLDVVFGDIRRFYTDEVLDHDVVSTHADRISAHLAVFRNVAAVRASFRRVRGWRAAMTDPRHLGFDESRYSRLFTRPRRWLALSRPPRFRTWFQERHSTILAPMPWHDGAATHPEAWRWRAGHLTNERDGDREFLYLHFMNWKSNRWLRPLGAAPPSAWMEQPTVVHMDPARADEGFRITRRGFEALA